MLKTVTIGQGWCDINTLWLNLQVMSYLYAFLSERGISTDIKFSDCEFFCKKAAFLRVQHGTTIAQEMKSSLEV